MPDVVVLGADGRPSPGRSPTPPTGALRVAFADELAPSLAGRLAPGPGAGGGRRRPSPSTRRCIPAAGAASRWPRSPSGWPGRWAWPPASSSRQVPSVLRVYPPFRSRDEAELRINRARILEVGLRSAQGRGGGTEFDQLREYSVDDEFRRMDWSATARTGKAIVRTYRAERNQTVISLLDNGRIMAGRVDDVPRVEHAMDAVMMLTAVSTRLGDRAGLVLFDREVRAVVPPSHGRDQLGRVTEAMYAAEPVLAESDYLGAFAATLARFRRRAMLVLFTDLVEQAVGETLLPALPLIARNHLVVVAAVQDPAVVRWALTTPVDAAGAYRKAAAVERPRRAPAHHRPAPGPGRHRGGRPARAVGAPAGRRLPQGEGGRAPLARPTGTVDYPA